MIRRDGQGPKLRAKGAETKGTLPFAMEIAMEMQTLRPDAHFKSVAACTSSMIDFCILLDADEWDRDAAAEACRHHEGHGQGAW